MDRAGNIHKWFDSTDEYREFNQKLSARLRTAVGNYTTENETINEAIALGMGFSPQKFSSLIQDYSGRQAKGGRSWAGPVIPAYLVWKIAELSGVTTDSLFGREGEESCEMAASDAPAGSGQYVLTDDEKLMIETYREFKRRISSDKTS